MTAELSGRGWEVRHLPLREMAVAPCDGCFGCWIRTPGECVRADDAREMARAVIGADLLVVLTPVTFGGYSSTVKRGIERLLPLLSPFFEVIGGEVHHARRYPRFPDYLALGVHPRPDSEAAELFRTLVERNAVNIHCRAHRAAVMPAEQPVVELRAAIAPLMDALDARA